MSYIIKITVPFSVGAIAGYFFRVFFEDKVIRKRDRYNRFALAYNTFSKEFTSALHHLDDPTKSSYVVIADEFPRHKEAMLNFEHMIRGAKSESRFRAKWAEYKQYCEKITQHGYSIFLGEEQGPPSAGVLKDIIGLDKVSEYEKDQPHKEQVKFLIKSLLETIQN